MKTKKFLSAVCVCSVMAGVSAHAALLATGQNSSSPYYADFGTSGLSISYTYNATTKTGVLNMYTGSLTGNSYNNPAVGSYDTFVAGSASPGTGPVGTISSPALVTSSSYALTATIKEDVNNNWYVYSGSLTISGTVDGLSGTLLTASLIGGASGAGTQYGTLGYTTGQNTPIDFLIQPTGGNTKILQDFLGTSSVGAIIVTPGSSQYTGDWTKALGINAQGQANTFVPEPVAYPVAASAFALFGLAWVTIRRKHA